MRGGIFIQRARVTPPEVGGFAVIGRGFLSPDPAPISTKSVLGLIFPPGEHDDITTGAPQRVFRFFRDSLAKEGCLAYAEREPEILGHAIGDTGSTEGWVYGERLITDVRGVYPIARTLGVVLLLASLVPVVLAVFSASGGDAGSAVLDLAVFLLLFGAGVWLTRQHAFESELLFIALKGEVYKSTLGAGTRLATQVADTGRASLISELRVTFKAARVLSENTSLPSASGFGSGEKIRVVTSVSDSVNARQGLQNLLDDFSHHILPKVVLQKSREQAVQEIGAGVARDPSVSHERFTKCGYCGTLSREGIRLCSGCGASLY